MVDVNNANRSLTVEQSEADFITIKKKLKNEEYAVEILVFKKDDIDELLSIQKEFYAAGTEKKDLIERLLTILRKLNVHK